MKSWTPTLIILLALLVSVPVHAASEEKNSQEELRRNAEEMGKQLQEMSQEMTRAFLQKLQEFLNRELEHLKDISPKSRETLQRQLDSIETNLKKHPDDPAAHFELAEVYDRLGDGANAIIHMQQAEALYKKQGDIKGLAEARRSLRDLYSRYEFQPQDFQLDT